MLKSHVQEPEQSAKACVIWLHGLGANAADLMGVSQVFSTKAPIRHVFLDADVRPVTLNNKMPMQAWYDIFGLASDSTEDRAGILQSEQQIRAEIAKQQDQGFSPEQIYVFGFSQGGAMALFVGLRSVVPLGGLAVLSAYLPLRSECEPIYVPSTPIFMASGEFDMVVLPAWSKQSYEWVAKRMPHVLWKQYPMEHVISYDEIRDLAQWLDEQIVLRGDRG